MMSHLQHGLVTLLALASLILAAVDVALVPGNRTLQRDVAARQQFVQESVQLEGLYREIVNALANLAARNNDAEVREMLARHGITYTVNPPATADATQPETDSTPP